MTTQRTRPQGLETATIVHPTDPGVPEALERLRKAVPGCDPLAILPDVHPARIPRHVAIIMDGNGRWARQKGFPRVFGHRNGAAVVREVTEEACRLGIEVLTLYSFSLENWKRPPEEVAALMQLCLAYLEAEEAEMKRQNIRFRVIGRREGLPPDVVAAIDRVTRSTASSTGMTLCLAINYGSRAEIVDAARALARQVADGTLTPDQIDETTFHQHLYTGDLPDPDLLVRTAGELRVSNYLLWQISYAEIHVTRTLWPDFGRQGLHESVREYARRTRRFGGLAEGEDTPV